MPRFRRERSLAERLRDYVVKDLGGIFISFTSPSRDGVSDKIIILNSRVSFLELKAPNKERRALQVVWERDVRGQGFHAVGWADNFEDAKQFITIHHGPEHTSTNVDA